MPIINQVVKGGGTTPTGTIQITTNGTHDVTNYASADVQVPTTAPAYYIEKTLSANGTLQNTTRIINFVGVKNLDSRVLQNAWDGNTSVTGTIDMPDLEQVSGSSAAKYCFSGTQTTGFRANKLTTVTGGSALSYLFYNTSVASVEINNLRVVSGSSAFEYAFGYAQLTSFCLPSLEDVSGGYALRDMLYRSTVVDVSFPSLKTLGQTALNTMCRNCAGLQSVWFYALNTDSFGIYSTCFNSMLSGDSNVTVHFPIRIQTTISSWTSVTSGFDGTNTTVLFDLVTSLVGADTNTYMRSEKDSTATATAWKYNDVLYYTSGVSNHTAGVNEPAVGDTIYSDSACTTAVTTVGSIA